MLTVPALGRPGWAPGGLGHAQHVEQQRPEVLASRGCVSQVRPKSSRGAPPPKCAKGLHRHRRRRLASPPDHAVAERRPFVRLHRLGDGRRRLRPEDVAAEEAVDGLPHLEVIVVPRVHVQPRQAFVRAVQPVDLAYGGQFALGRPRRPVAGATAHEERVRREEPREFHVRRVQPEQRRVLAEAASLVAVQSCRWARPRRPARPRRRARTSAWRRPSTP